MPKFLSFPINTIPFLCLLLNHFQSSKAAYDIGVGIADVTGPIVEVNFMGYGRFDQAGCGLHLRQWARTFIIGDENVRMAFVSVDVGMMGDGVRIRVIQKLQHEFGNIYNLDNLIISGTHTHSAPGGFNIYVLFDLPIKGYSKETFDALVEGIVKSVRSAHFSIQKGRVYLSRGNVVNANINRSPSAYLNNPDWERAMYKENTDTELIQLKFMSLNNEPLGALNWFPVHPTSMNNTNTLVSSDNVGYASIKFEQAMNGKCVLGKGPFVAAFASSNLGDVSPNIAGPKCQKSGKRCDAKTSSCPGDDVCVASGPGKDMFESTAIIADKLFQKAWELWLLPSEEITGPIRIIHQYIDMTKAEAEILGPNGNLTKVKGCLPAMGYSFAAGTVDGPGAFSFKQGTLSTNPVWNLVRNILATPNREDHICHAPKPILLATGRMTFPFLWQPKVVSTQLALLGNVAIIAVPGEFTTMAGRRMKNEMAELMIQWGVKNPVSIIAGLCNTYSDYITTFEEYQVQRYEGASTIYGPHTLSLYIHQYGKLMTALLENRSLDRGPEPKGLFSYKLNFILPVIYDRPPSGHNFGDVIKGPPKKVRPGMVTTVTFVSANPRTTPIRGGTYFTIERLESPETDMWSVEATDANWETKVKWRRKNLVMGSSEMDLEWTVPRDVHPGTYRIKHFGSYKTIFGNYSYVGSTEAFEVLNDIVRVAYP